MMKKKIFLMALLSAVFFVACSKDTESKTDSTTSGISSDEIGLRKTSIENENNVELPDINSTGLQPGESVLLERSFENAPPMISHAIDDMLPITKDNNMCLSCHIKEVAKDAGTVPAPATHYFDFTNNKPTGDVISNARFNCTQCHTPQSDVQPLVKNNFKAEFSNESLKSKSNLIDVVNEGVK